MRMHAHRMQMLTHLPSQAGLLLSVTQSRLIHASSMPSLRLKGICIHLPTRGTQPKSHKDYTNEDDTSTCAKKFAKICFPLPLPKPYHKLFLSPTCFIFPPDDSSDHLPWDLCSHDSSMQSYMINVECEAHSIVLSIKTCSMHKNFVSAFPKPL